MFLGRPTARTTICKFFFSLPFPTRTSTAIEFFLQPGKKVKDKKEVDSHTLILCLLGKSESSSSTWNSCSPCKPLPTPICFCVWFHIAYCIGLQSWKCAARRKRAHSDSGHFQIFVEPIGECICTILSHYYHHHDYQPGKKNLLGVGSGGVVAVASCLCLPTRRSQVQLSPTSSLPFIIKPPQDFSLPITQGLVFAKSSPWFYWVNPGNWCANAFSNGLSDDLEIFIFDMSRFTHSLKCQSPPRPSRPSLPTTFPLRFLGKQRARKDWCPPPFPASFFDSLQFLAGAAVMCAGGLQPTFQASSR